MDGKIKLPRDVDGVPIGVGHTVYYSNRTVAEELKVTALICYGEKWLVRCEGTPNAWINLEPEKLTHVPFDTLETIEGTIDEIIHYAHRIGLEGLEWPKEQFDREISHLMKRIKKLVEPSNG